MLKKFIPLCMIISLWCFKFFAYANDDTYINVLDTDDSFELNLKSIFNIIAIKDSSSIKIEKLSSSITEVLYAISRKVNDSTDANGIDNIESYVLRVFKQKTIYHGDIKIQIREPKSYSSLYTDYYLAEVTNTITHLYSKGLLPFINIANVDPTEYISMNEFALEWFEQLFTMSNVISRQLELQSSLEHDNILGTFTVQGNIFINKPDNSLLNYIFNDIDKENINEILKIMHSIASAVEYLHSKGIAHGDIIPNNLFVKDNNVVLSGFERFNQSNSPNIKLKEFNFANSFCYDPEIRKPANNKLTTIPTSYSDVYSLGITFSVILHLICPEDFHMAIRRMTKNNAMILNHFHEFAQQQKLNKFQLPEMSSYNPLFIDIKKIIAFLNYIDTTQISTINNQFLKYLFGRCKYPTDIMQKLLDIIDQCHKKNITDRAEVTDIKDQLFNLIGN